MRVIRIEQKPKVRRYTFGDLEVGEACITNSGEDLILRCISSIVISTPERWDVVNAIVENTGILTYIDSKTEVLLCNLTIEANAPDPTTVKDDDNYFKMKFGELRISELYTFEKDGDLYVKTSAVTASPVIKNRVDFEDSYHFDDDKIVYVAKP